MAKKHLNPKKEEVRPISPFVDAVEEFTFNIESMHSSLYEVLMKGLYLDAKKKHERFKKIWRTATKTRGRKEFVKIESLSIFEKAYRDARQSRIAADSVPKSIFVMLVSNLDNHFKRILKIIFELRPVLIDDTEKNISLSELFEMEDIEEIKAYVLDREMDQILENRLKFLEWLRRKIGVDIDINDKLMGRLIEATERRNAIVHAEGCVTQRYLDICKKRKVEFKKTKKVGDKFDMPPEYFTSSFIVIYLVGIKTSHLVWRKMEKEQEGLDEADTHLNEIIVDLLNRSWFPVAVELAEFANNLPSFSTEKNRLMFLINLALSYKFSKQQKKAEDVLLKQDWSAAEDDFKLAVAIIRNDMKLASEIMRRIGPQKDMQQSYRLWPLFLEFRRTKKFSSLYKEIYGEDYIAIPDEKPDDA